MEVVLNIIKKQKGYEYESFMSSLEDLKREGLFFTDTHCHLSYPPLDSDTEAVIEESYRHGINRIVTIGTSIEDSKKCVKIAERYDNVYSSVGIHPSDIDKSDSLSEESFTALKNLCSSNKVIAVGEIGLDYYHRQDNKREQANHLHRLLELAYEVEKPIVIHNRESTEDLIDILGENRDKLPTEAGIMHCFSGDEKMLEFSLANNFYISYAGPITFNSAHELRKSIEKVPLDRLLLETDAPFLTPMPYRGVKNQPAYSCFVAYTMAKVKGISLADLAGNLENNLQRLIAL